MNHQNVTITITTLTLGTTSFEEFVTHEKSKRGTVDAARKRPRFDAINTDKNGTLSKQELTTAPKGTRYK